MNSLETLTANLELLQSIKQLLKSKPSAFVMHKIDAMLDDINNDIDKVLKDMEKCQRK